MRRGGLLPALLLATVAPSLAFSAGPLMQRQKVTATPTPVVAKETPGEEIYRLGREALGRGSFETAARLFAALDQESRFETDGRYAFNRAQALRYANDPGEAVYWFGRYLALSPAASDAKQVEEQVQKLVASSPAAVRQSALSRLRADFDRLEADPEISRTLLEMPLVNLVVRFVKKGDPAASTAPTYVFPARAVFWKAPLEDTPESSWQTWILPMAPVVVPDGLGPNLLLLPPGRPFPVEMGAELISKKVVLSGVRVPYFPPEAELESWSIEVVAEVKAMGAPVFVVGTQAPAPMVEVKSSRDERPLVVGKKRREVPVVSTPISFGPRATRPDSKVFPKVPLAVLDLQGRDGAVERWAATMSSLEVVNRFGKLVTKAGEPDRIYVRAEESGPFLLGLTIR